MSGPLFDDLVDDDVTGEERERMLRVHELLLQADAPPELPPALEKPVRPPTAEVRLLPRRSKLTLALIAAAVALVAFAAGYAAHKQPTAFKSDLAAIPMKGTEAAPAALASIQLAKKDEAGNWPMRVSEHGLKELPTGGYYELWLTRKGKPVASCGTFAVHGEDTTVEMSVPYNLREYDGWVVTAHVPGQHAQPTLLTT